MRYIRYIGFCWLTALALGVGRAQTTQAVGGELPVAAENDAPFEVVSAGRLGVAVLMKQNDLFASAPQRNVYFFDENLKLRWTAVLPMESSYCYMAYEVEEDSLRLFLTTLPEKSRVPAFLEVAVCLLNGRFALYPRAVDVSSLTKASAVGFARNDEAWHMLIKTRDAYNYCRFRPGEDSLYIKPVASSHEYECLDIVWNLPKNQAFCLFRDAKIDDKNLYVQVVDMSLQSGLVQHITINPPSGDIRLIDGRIAVAGPGSVLVAGVWNPASYKQHLSFYDKGSESAGVFTAFYQNNFLKSFELRPYLDFPDLENLMSEDEAYKINHARQKAAGRAIQPDYLALSRLWNSNGAFHFLAETYDRKETTYTDVTYDFYGRMVPYTRSRFDGYFFKNAFYLKLDSTGNEERTSVFNIQHTNPEEGLEPVAACLEDTATGRFLYAFAHQNSVCFRSFNRNAQAAGVKNFRLPATVPGDKVQKTWKENVMPWYEGVMLSYGYRQVVNARRRGKSRQNVFYLNKLVVE